MYFVGNIFDEQNNNKEIKDFSKNGKCSMCGSCCNNLLIMTDEEIKTIKKYIKKNKIKENVRNAPTNYLLVDTTCPFLDHSATENKCRIYKVRPQICREFFCSKELNFNWILSNPLKYNTVNCRKVFFGNT